MTGIPFGWIVTLFMSIVTLVYAFVRESQRAEKLREQLAAERSRIDSLQREIAEKQSELEGLQQRLRPFRAPEPEPEPEPVATIDDYRGREILCEH